MGLCDFLRYKLLMKSSLTVYERVFLEKYLRYKNGTKAALETFNIQGKNKRKIASTMASQILQRPRITQYINGLISDEELVRLLKKGLYACRTSGSIRHADWNTRIKSLEIAFRLHGMFINRTTEPMSKSAPQVTFVRK